MKSCGNWTLYIPLWPRICRIGNQSTPCLWYVIQIAVIIRLVVNGQYSVSHRLLYPRIAKRTSPLLSCVNGRRPIPFNSLLTSAKRNKSLFVVLYVCGRKWRAVEIRPYIYTSPLSHPPNRESVFPFPFNPGFCFKVSHISTNSKQNHPLLTMQTKGVPFPFNILQAVAKTEACLLLTLTYWNF